MDSLAAVFQHIATGTLLALDLIGTFVFALSGAIVGVRQHLDIFGDLLLPAPIGDPSRLATAERAPRI